VFAAGQTYGTANTTNNYVYWYENIVGDTSNGNDTLLTWPQGPISFDAIPHTPSGTCNAPGLKVGDDWGNCISSLRVYWRRVDKDLCLYDNANGDLGLGNVYRLNYSTVMNNVRANIGWATGYVIPSDTLGAYKWINETDHCQPQQ
jgi:hypothetical protein